MLRFNNEMSSGRRFSCIASLCLVIGIGVSGCGSGSGTTVQSIPLASVATLSPAGASAGTGAVTLNVKGADFVQGSTVNWNGNSRTTTFVSSTQLQAHIMAADLANVGKVPVTVVNSVGGASNAITFTISAATITFQSTRALDGTDAANTNNTTNIWSMNPDGSAQKPLTRLTAN